jgi:hypothetical protein
LGNPLSCGAGGSPFSTVEFNPDFAFAVPIFSKALPVGSLPTLKTENSITV